MDKLKPILAQKFWILLSVGLIVSFVGWYMASGALATAIDKRTAEIKTARDSANIGEVPNSTWPAAVEKINAEQSVLVDAAKYKLWQDETAVMEWPEPMIEFLQKATAYRGDMDPLAPTVYRNYYPRAFEGVWKTVRPISQYDPTGIVDFPAAKMLPYRSWGNLTPTYQEIWEAQEDLWLFKALLKSVLTVNGGEEATKLDASIHAIQKLELMGGDRSTIDAGGGGGGGGMGGVMGGDSDDGAAGLMGAGYGGGGLMGGGSGGGGAETMGGGRGATASADFDPKEEFGNPGGTAAGGGGGAGNMGMLGAGGAELSGDPGGGQTAASAPRRYIDDDENQPYQTRGFYLSVIMDHRRVPQLLAELTANEYSPFPVEIVRVQIARLNDDSPGGSQRAMGGMAGGTMGGSFTGGNPFAGGGASVAEDSDDRESDAFGGGNSLPGFGGASVGGGRMGGGSDPYLTDPFMSQVAIAGIMTIYRKASPPVLPGSAAPAADTEAVPASVSADPEPTAPPEAVPADGTAPSEAPAAPATGTVPAPAAAAAPATEAATPAVPADDAPKP